MVMQVTQEYLNTLDYGLDDAIAAYQQALKAHAKTVGTAAPVASALVENIVRDHGGKYEIVPPEAAIGGQAALAAWQQMVVTRISAIEAQLLTLVQEINRVKFQLNVLTTASIPTVNLPPIDDEPAAPPAKSKK